MFYLVCPHYLENYIEEQVHAQYPEAQIEKTEDYNLFSPKAEIRGTYLNLRRSPFFPVKTYKEGESDPLNALTNVLSKLSEDEGAAIQILVKPAFRSWAGKGLKVASLMQQGKKLKDALKEAGEASRTFERVGSIIEGTVGIAASSLEEGKKSEAKQQPVEQKMHKLSPLEEEIVKGIENKASKFVFECNLRIIASSNDAMRAELSLSNISNAFAQYDAGEKGNGFKNIKVKLDQLVSDFIFRNFRMRGRFILSTEELTSLWHLPLPQTETPNILWLTAKKAPAPVNLPQEGIILGRNIYRGVEKSVRIKRDDRRRHVYIIGRSGSGKSVLLANMAVQDIQNGEGVCVLDPHGDLIEMILEHIPKERIDDVIYFDPADIERPMGLNMLEYRTDDQKDFLVQEMIAIFYKLFPAEMIGPMFEHNMRNAMLTLMADKEQLGTIMEIPRIFTDKDFVQYKLKVSKILLFVRFGRKRWRRQQSFISQRCWVI
jgi:hypothetical protein